MNPADDGRPFQEYPSFLVWTPETNSKPKKGNKTMQTPLPGKVKPETPAGVSSTITVRSKVSTVDIVTKERSFRMANSTIKTMSKVVKTRKETIKGMEISGYQDSLTRILERRNGSARQEC